MIFSFKKSRFFWLRSNFILLLLTALLLMNKPYWEKDANVMFFMFVFTAEFFLILLSLVYGFQTEKVILSQRKRAFNKSNFVHGIIVLIFLSIFFALALGEHMPFPSSLFYASILINVIMAVISLIFPSWVIKQYEFSIYEESNGHINDLLRYFLFFAWTINYEVQIVLARLPFVLQRLLGVIFVAVLLWELTMIGLIFENN